ncbi:ATP-binding protein [Xylophilus sp.]|uniref:ATP-binding protein n=1 Tax=Xylophilus sp. TaxID=2653893 RepID=UPI0013B913CA|nr:ATP-binding protein [Xylophilus sp.]KAF1043772.1 MAG: Sensor protein QseC [Xylophilus sp.]
MTVLPATLARRLGLGSLRGRLLWFVLTSILLAAGVLAASAWRGALREADALFDYHLQQIAHSLRDSVPLGSVGDIEGVGPDDFDLHVQIWGPDGVQIYRSARSVLPPRAVLGFSDVTAQGRRYRVYSVQTPLQTVQIAQDMSARRDRAGALALRATLPMALVAPLLMLAVAWVIGRSLAPLERMRQQVARRPADDLSPLAGGDLPDEVRPLVDELNLLFGRVQAAFDAQQHFIADAAHELRSPLTALRLQARALRRSGEGTAQPALDRLDEGIGRAIALVGQLLDLARQEADGRGGAPREPVDLSEVIRLAVADVLPQAQARNIDLGLADAAPGAPPRVRGRPEALRTLLRNLLDNAVKYTPPGGRVDVGLQAAADGGVLLAVDDSGPGLPAAERERVFDRFYRNPDAAAGATGSGLGLAIVAAIARQHGARVALSASPTLGGLRAEVLFPGYGPSGP